jgi:hypothetical protein
VPATIFTDSDPAIALAIRTEFPEPETVHLLCTWHLSLNFNTNVRSCYPGDEGSKRWNAVKRKFWSLAKDSDSQGAANFDVSFGELVDMIKCSGGSTTSIDGAVKWLNNTLYAKRFQWAACFTWKHGT